MIWKCATTLSRLSSAYLSPSHHQGLHCTFVSLLSPSLVLPCYCFLPFLLSVILLHLPFFLHFIRPSLPPSYSTSTSLLHLFSAHLFSVLSFSLSLLPSLPQHWPFKMYIGRLYDVKQVLCKLFKVLNSL